VAVMETVVQRWDVFTHSFVSLRSTETVGCTLSFLIAGLQPRRARLLV
jgi:hypothetical protein